MTSALVPTLLASAVLSFAGTAIYGYVGWRLWHRRVADEAAMAARFFALWWVGLAVTSAVSGLLRGLAAFGVTDVAFHATLTYLNVTVLCAAMFGLMDYLLYVYSGSRGVARAGGAVITAGLYLLLVYFITVSQPAGVTVERWAVGLGYGNPHFLMVILLCLVVPPMLLGLLYFTLYFKVTGITRRARVAVVSWGIILFFGSAFLARLIPNRDWSQVASQLIRLATGVAILSVYHPPGWIRTRFGIVSLDDEVGRAG